jgi:serine/threonine-protein kinase HipA
MTRAAVLGVHLLTETGGLVRVGTLTRDARGATAFLVDESYYRTPDRSILSLRWHDIRGEEATRQRLGDRGDKIGLNNNLPPWFAGLLPEGALRELVEREMGAGDHGDFDVLARLGAELPGAVVVLPETNVEGAGPLRLERVAGFEAPVPDGIVKFSLAGVQLKFAVDLAGERLTLPVRGGAGRYILKAPAERFPDLPEAEFAAMSLCRASGIDTADVHLVPVSSIDGIPKELLTHGEHALAVRRFDRTPQGGRVHIEDMAQIIGAVGDRKYTMANSESVLNIVSRFSTRRLPDVTQAMQRVAADILIGNGDNHLKNWSFIYPDPRAPRLSPAYDIVPTILFMPRDRLALPFIGKRDFESVSTADFERAGRYLGLRAGEATRAVYTFVDRSLAAWPALISELPLPAAAKSQLLERLDGLRLVQETREWASSRGRAR